MQSRQKVMPRLPPKPPYVLATYIPHERHRMKQILQRIKDNCCPKNVGT